MITVKSYKPSEASLTVEIVVPWNDMAGISVKALCAAQVEHGSDGWEVLAHGNWEFQSDPNGPMIWYPTPGKPASFAALETSIQIPDTDGPVFITPSKGMVGALESEFDNWLDKQSQYDVEKFSTESALVAA